ncbi:unnamed protein product [Commensalibacter papalotli (ex Botero et al. 2024)]|uniref:Uncharacterized protein n=2 Tax=Commensalibacter TaxID=1079922 RepID=W7DXY4_9PROT|nr:hypothetical protein COMX_05015 [Commensalibacter papalotli (ex Servin-Garciduenas et al. 2014)]CAI3922884.1 unnamed protein product [Commensalibacter papalotli (ex Botero et al. 2024)]CAI3929171.1 unnamed protein product [Commensalibacter papalotli (ex Botero et al. 2024)]
MNLSEIIHITNRVFVGSYWIIISLLSIVLIYLCITYYQNHYFDPKKNLFQKYIWDAATLNLTRQTQQSFEQCLQKQDTSKNYPSQIMKECIFKAAAKL